MRGYDLTHSSVNGKEDSASWCSTHTNTHLIPLQFVTPPKSYSPTSSSELWSSRGGSSASALFCVSTLWATLGETSLQLNALHPVCDKCYCTSSGVWQIFSPLHFINYCYPKSSSFCCCSNLFKTNYNCTPDALICSCQLVEPIEVAIYFQT